MAESRSMFGLKLNAFGPQCSTQSQGVWMINVQHIDSCSTHACFASQRNAIPNEVLVPIILTRIEEFSELPGQRIEAGYVWPFAQVARETGPGQIVCRGFAVVLFGDDVVNVKRKLGRVLREVAVFATAQRAANDQCLQRATRACH
jgi:hypothetical protein